MASANGAWRVLSSCAIPLLIGFAGSALAQDIVLPPKGFAPADIAQIVATWPFTDPAFRTANGVRSTGAAEATVKALADEISFSARFLPTAPAPQIALGAEQRPPPDTTLWPEPIAADAFAHPSVRSDAAMWTLDGRPDRALHETNARMLGQLVALAARTSASDVAALLPAPDPAVRDAARSFAGTIEARLRQYLERTDCTEVWCQVMEAVQRKAAADGATAPIEDALADYFWTAARSGTFAANTRAQQAVRAERDAQRALVAFERTGAEQTAPPLPWDLRLVLGQVLLDLRGLAPLAGPWPVAYQGEDVAARVRTARSDLAGFDLEGVAVTRYNAAAGDEIELAAAVTLLDAAARRQSLSVVLRFRFGDGAVRIGRADIAAIAPEQPAVRVAFVSVGALSPAQLATSSGTALLQTAVQNEERRGDGSAREYCAFAFVLDRLDPAARVGLRTSRTAATIAGYPGMPAMLDYEGWRVLVQCATFALGAQPPFYFKTIYQATLQAAPLLLDATATGAEPVVRAATAVTERRPLAASLPNRVKR